ncbi:MAG: hypothetical protein LBM93_15550 [Oscillospiraceae bacterium]|jgi:hypothetical protein|nr:hypothetical protein [Oscillospiraceae bacterium]
MGKCVVNQNIDAMDSNIDARDFEEEYEEQEVYMFKSEKRYPFEIISDKVSDEELHKFFEEAGIA